MADNNQTPTTDEHIPIETAGLEIPGAAFGDVVVDMDTINELMKQRKAAEREAVEQAEEKTAEADKAPEGAELPSPSDMDKGEGTRPPWERTQDELDTENKKPRRGRPPKEAAEQTGPEGEKSRRTRSPARAAQPRLTRPPRIRARSQFETKWSC